MKTNQILILLFLTGCNLPQMNNNLDIQGHRGCRGLYPENTIEGFKKALDLGVRTLEMDVVISKDNQVVISHEPFFNHEISTSPDGDTIQEIDEKKHNIYQLTYEEIADYDVGLAPHPRFPNQSKIKATKPLLSAMFESIESYKKDLGREVYYNIEIKRVEENDGIYHPPSQEFVDLVLKTIKASGCDNRVSVQCFNHETLAHVHSSYPDQQTVMLIADTITPQKHLDKLGFTPTIYSPYYELVDKELIAFCSQKNMKVIPWTVNTPEETTRLIKLEVDGIISDYPDMTIEVWEGLQLEQ